MQAVAISERVHERLGGGYAQVCVARAMADLGDARGALSGIEGALRVGTDLGQQDLRAEALAALVDACLRLGETAPAASAAIQ